MLSDILFLVINLAHEKQKRQIIQNRLENLGLKYHFIDAVYGKDLSEEEKNKLVASKEKQLKFRKKTLNDGEIGCALSHKKCYEYIVNNNLLNAVIIEDDAVFDEKLIDFLSHKDEFLPDLDLLLLGHQRQVYVDDGFRIESPYSRRFCKIIADYKIRRLVGRGNGAYGYFITNLGARKLLKHMQEIFIPSDFYTSDEKFSNIYALFPVLISTSDAGISATQSGVIDKKRSKIGKYFKRFRCFIMFFIPSLKSLKPYKIADKIQNN